MTSEEGSYDEASLARKVPVLLLKTKSSPTDSYEEYFSTTDFSVYQPSFVPVLEHRFREETLSWLHSTVENGGFAKDLPNPGINNGEEDIRPSRYGGLILTSQRAVEAFTAVVAQFPPEIRHSILPASLPLYVVGPATARSLRALNLPCPILGEETGNGEALARFILSNHTNLAPPPKSHTVAAAAAAPTAAIRRKLPLLFLVGEQRRDIIPKTLQSPTLPPEQRIPVHEEIIYETGEMASFRSDFTAACRRNARRGAKKQWFVVFSPTGCEAMLQGLGWLDDETGRVKTGCGGRVGRSRDGGGCDMFVATIGPTTRDYLIDRFGFEPHVCAERPSPEGIGEAIAAFERANP
ncbi:uroporphyrinogen-III synthase [Elasticomyces elasticus]|nr:uroporphyrinogen-III synthase [Elasticomyces elasticus]